MVIHNETEGVLPLWEVGSSGVLTNFQFYGGGGGMGVCLLSSFLLLRIKHVRYLMAFCWMFFMRFLMWVFGILRLVSLLIRCSCMAPRTPDVIVMRGLIFHHLFCRFWINGS